jgi:uncharacterized protein
MSLREKIDQAIRDAMKSREKDKLDAFRAIKAAVLLAETEKGSSGQLTDDQELKIIQKLIKQRKEAAEIYSAQNRQDLADIELLQSGFIEDYLPAMMDEFALTDEIKKIIANLGVTDPKDFGKVMGTASKLFAGKADNKMISDIIRKLLS